MTRTATRWGAGGSNHDHPSIPHRLRARVGEHRRPHSPRAIPAAWNAHRPAGSPRDVRTREEAVTNYHAYIGPLFAGYIIAPDHVQALELARKEHGPEVRILYGRN